MKGFENTQIIEMNTNGMTLKQEVRVIDGSLFLAHWHACDKFWSYDQLSKEYIDNQGFTENQRNLLLKIWENLEDIRITINTLRIEKGCIDEMIVGGLIIRNR